MTWMISIAWCCRQVPLGKPKAPAEPPRRKQAEPSFQENTPELHYLWWVWGREDAFMVFGPKSILDKTATDKKFSPQYHAQKKTHFILINSARFFLRLCLCQETLFGHGQTSFSIPDLHQKPKSTVGMCRSSPPVSFLTWTLQLFSLFKPLT